MTRIMTRMPTQMRGACAALSRDHPMTPRWEEDQSGAARQNPLEINLPADEIESHSCGMGADAACPHGAQPSSITNYAQ